MKPKLFRKQTGWSFRSPTLVVAALADSHAVAAVALASALGGAAAFLPAVLYADKTAEARGPVYKSLQRIALLTTCVIQPSCDK